MLYAYGKNEKGVRHNSDTQLKRIYLIFLAGQKVRLERVKMKAMCYVNVFCFLEFDT